MKNKSSLKLNEQSISIVNTSLTNLVMANFITLLFAHLLFLYDNDVHYQIIKY